MNAREGTSVSEGIREQVRRFIVGTFLFGDEPEWLTEESSLLESGVIDSTGVLELIGFIQKEFAIEIADDEVLPSNLDSLRNIEQYVAAKTRRTEAT